MRLKASFSVLDNLLRKCYITPHHSCLIQTRHFAPTSTRCIGNVKQAVEDVAILGGGITGLTSAYLLASHPESKRIKVTLIESNSRLGGWLRSTSIDVGTGKVVFEQGPRNLRPSIPNGYFTIDLIRKLGIADRVLMTSKESVAAQNRFIYYPDRLVRLPGPGFSLTNNISTLLREPIFKGVLFDLIKEPFAKTLDRSKYVDESVGDFFSRRFGSTIVDNVLSAVIHGIYAGDVYKLSALALFERLKMYETDVGSVLFGPFTEWINDERLAPDMDATLMELLKSHMYNRVGKRNLGTEVFRRIRKSSVFTFKGGIGELAERLEAALSALPNVKILRDTSVETIEYTADEDSSKVQVATRYLKSKKQLDHQYTHVISTVSGKALNAVVQPANSLTSLVSPAVTVMVVNLFYRSPNLLPVHGFGYLLPRSLPFNQNPERALGVVFDSDATIGQDDVSGTKVTVMLGGHWWDGWETYPDEEKGAYMAKSILARHLNVTTEPDAVRVGLQKECIPQYTVGFYDRLKEGSRKLAENFDGRLRVAGSSYHGVGMNDCIRAAHDVVRDLSIGYGKTGLNRVEEGLLPYWVKQKGPKLTRWTEDDIE